MTYNSRKNILTGSAAALSAYTLWGLAPIFWKLLAEVDAVELIAHRILWATPTLMIVIAIQGSWKGFLPAFQSWKTFAALTVSATLIISNWFIFVYAIITDRILETSLGYFINPLVFTFLGYVILGERLRKRQSIAVLIAVAGVAYLAINNGSIPWIALTLAGSFATYGVIRKRIPVEGLHALALETSIGFPFAVGYLVFLGSEGTFAFEPDLNNLLLVSAGPITAIPLLFFGYAVRRITLATIGFLQYLAPTMTFLLGVFVYNEPFSSETLVAFACIWVALILYSIDGVLHARQIKTSDDLQV